MRASDRTRLLAGSAALLVFGIAAGALFFGRQPPHSDLAPQRPAPPIAAATARGQVYPGAPERAAPPVAGTKTTPAAAPSVSGRVLDPSGRPAPSASVVARPAGVLGEGRRWERWCVLTRTDARGAFRLEDVPPGDVELAADLLPYAPAFRFATVPAEEDVDLYLQEGVAIRGHVLDEAGNPVAGAKVGASGFWTSRDRVATTDGAGAYCIRSIPPGAEVAVRVEAYGREPPEPRAALVLPRSGEIDGIDFVVEAVAAVSGCVVDATGVPVAGARVLVDPLSTVTAGDGTFRLDYLTAGEHAIEVTGPDGARTAHRTVTLAAGSETPAVQLVLGAPGRLRGSIRDSRGAPVDGRLIVKKESGDDWRPAAADFDVEVAPGKLEVSAWARGFRPSASVEVEVRSGETIPDLALVVRGLPAIAGRVRGTPPPREPARVRLVKDDSAARCDADGFFRLENVTPGIATLLATTDDGRIGWISVRVTDDRDVDAVEIELGPAGRLEGRIDGPDGRQSTVLCYLVQGDGIGFEQLACVRSDDDGRFAVTELPPGRYVLIAGRNVSRKIDVGPGETVKDVEILRPPTAPASRTAR